MNPHLCLQIQIYWWIKEIRIRIYRLGMKKVKGGLLRLLLSYLIRNIRGIYYIIMCHFVPYLVKLCPQLDTGYPAIGNKKSKKRSLMFLFIETDKYGMQLSILSSFSKIQILHIFQIGKSRHIRQETMAFLIFTVYISTRYW